LTNLRAEKSVSANDTPQRLVIAVVYELPLGRGKALGRGMNRVLDGFVGGWRVNTISTFQSGQPITLFESNNLLSDGHQRPNVTGNPCSGANILDVVSTSLGSGSANANYFNSSMKDAQLPTLKGKVVSLEPETKPKTIIMALEDGKTPDATLKFDAALPGKVDPGTELTFEGVPQSYTTSPFMVVFAVEKDKLRGWTGKNTPAPVHHRPKPAGKK
jgi:hypothetical protein